eukprot:m.76389 g.76389  ORF g.76389 m.76389 type:complete len:690 (-) comp9057_c0_seq1:74-2143(-)
MIMVQSVHSRGGSDCGTALPCQRVATTMWSLCLVLMPWPRIASASVDVVRAETDSSLSDIAPHHTRHSLLDGVTSPVNGDDCGKGVTCYGCASRTWAAHRLTSALNCSNATQIHPNTCQHNPSGLIRSTTVTNATQCCAECTGNTQCVSFTFWGTNECHLFRSVGKLANGAGCVTGAAASLPPGPAPPAPPPAPPGPACTDCPNIVLMFTDDQDLTLGGWADDVMTQTKRVLQSRGVLASNWTIHTPICAPSRGELMSGRYFQNIKNDAMTPPSTLCGSGAVGHLDLDNKVYPNTFVQELRLQKGYTTGLFGKCMNGGCKDPPAMAGAFDRWFEGTDYQNGTFFDNDSPNNAFNAAGYAGGYLTSVLGNKTIEWIKNVTVSQSDRPFFIYFAPHAPHSPATPAAWYVDACNGTMSPRNPAYNYSSPLFHNLVARQPPLTATDAITIDELARKRCQTLLSVDDSYSELVAFIDGLNLNRKTYYLVSSDHGYNLGQHRLPSNKFLLYDHSLRIPMLFVGPGIPAGVEVGYRGTNVDVGPTILGFAGAVPPAGMDGQNIAPLLITQPDLAPASTRRLLAQTALPPSRDASFHVYFNQGPWEVGTEHALDDWSNTYIGLSGYFPGYGTFKYGEYDPYGKQSNFTSVYLIELFDLNADPFELDNIYATASPELKALLHTEVHRMYGCAGAAQCG